jgi:hypothetical protein
VEEAHKGGSKKLLTNISWSKVFLIPLKRLLIHSQYIPDAKLYKMQNYSEGKKTENAKLFRMQNYSEDRMVQNAK